MLSEPTRRFTFTGSGDLDGQEVYATLSALRMPDRVVWFVNGTAVFAVAGGGLVVNERFFDAIGRPARSSR